jgi:hypothetical protein
VTATAVNLRHTRLGETLSVNVGQEPVRGDIEIDVAVSVDSAVMCRGLRACTVRDPRST